MFSATLRCILIQRDFAVDSFNENGAESKEKGTVDFSMNAREIYRTFQRTGVDLRRIRPVDAVKFSMGQEYVYGQAGSPIAFNYEKEPEIVKIDGKLVAIAHNLGQSGRLLDQVKAGTCKFDVIRLSA